MGRWLTAGGVGGRRRGVGDGGAAAAVVLGDGEEDEEVRSGLGVRMVASGLIRGVGVGEAKAEALRGLRRGRASSGRRLRRDLGEEKVSKRRASSRWHD